MKLIKLTEEHYVIVDENKDINENDYTFKNGEIRQVSYLMQDNGNVITHSTNINFNEVYYIPLQEVKELIGEVDVEKKVKEYYKKDTTLNNPSSFKAGYNQALEDNKEKKYTEEDLRNAFIEGTNAGALHERLSDYDNGDYEEAEQACLDKLIEIVKSK